MNNYEKKFGRHKGKNKFKEIFTRSGKIKSAYAHIFWVPEEYTDISFNKIREKNKTKEFFECFEIGDVAYKENSLKAHFKNYYSINIYYNSSYTFKLIAHKEDILTFPFLSDEEKLILECGGYDDEMLEILWEA